MNEGYIALAACILTDKSPEQAFKSLWRENIVPKSGRPTGPVSEDTIKMAELRETMTYKQVGERFGITGGAVFRRIQRYREIQEAQHGTI